MAAGKPSPADLAAELRDAARRARIRLSQAKACPSEPPDWRLFVCRHLSPRSASLDLLLCGETPDERSAWLERILPKRPPFLEILH